MYVISTTLFDDAEDRNVSYFNAIFIFMEYHPILNFFQDNKVKFKIEKFGPLWIKDTQFKVSTGLLPVSTGDYLFVALL